MLADVFGAVGKGHLITYVGLGARVSTHFEDTQRAGVRTPFGIAYVFADGTLELFGQVAPGLAWGGPQVEAVLGAGTGIRVALF